MYGLWLLYVKFTPRLLIFLLKAMNSTLVTFCIIAGGQGLRLGGTYKGLIHVGGESIVKRLLGLGAPFHERLLVTNDAAPYASCTEARIVGDVEAGFGAPGGVVSALLAARTPFTLICACDMPFLTKPLVQRLLDRADGSEDVVCFTRDLRREPLCALYRSSLGARWRPKLTQQRSLRWLLNDQSIRVVDEALSDSEGVLLESLNTPADLQRWSATVQKF